MAEDIITIDQIFTFEDKNGNLYYCRDQKLTLRLKSESRSRNVGEIIVINDLIIFKKPEDLKQIHRKTNSWSVPVEIFEKVEGIWFYTNRNNYKILTKEAKKNMSYLSFNKSGYENKVYIPLNLWRIEPLNT